jgi:ribosomal-protein-serine acetyltransferase
MGFVLAIRAEEKIVGLIDMHKIDVINLSASIGYWLDRNKQGRGIMTRSCRAVVSHAFSIYGLNRIEIRCAVGNMHSAAIPKRLGFGYEGVCREAEWLYDHFASHEVYSMLAKDWRPVQDAVA